MAKKKSISPKDITEGKIFAVLAYLSICCIIPLVFKKDNPFVLNHGRQGLVIFVAEIGVFIVHIVLGQWIWKLGIFVLGVYSFIGIINVLMGKDVRLPFVSDIADKIVL